MEGEQASKAIICHIGLNAPPPPPHPPSKHKRSGQSRTGERPHLKNGNDQGWLVPAAFTPEDVHPAKMFGLTNNILQNSDLKIFPKKRQLSADNQ